MGAFPVVEHMPKVWYYQNAPMFMNKAWVNLDSSIASALNFLQTSNARFMFHKLADYCQNVLTPISLAQNLTNKIQHRLQTRTENHQALLQIRKGIIQNEDMGAIKL